MQRQNLLATLTLYVLAISFAPIVDAQTNDWRYMGGNEKSEYLYLGTTAFRHPKQPRQVFYKLLLVMPKPMPAHIKSILFEMMGNCEQVSNMVLNVVVYDRSGNLLTQVKPQDIAPNDRQNLENMTLGSSGRNLLNQACKISSKL